MIFSVFVRFYVNWRAPLCAHSPYLCVRVLSSLPIIHQNFLLWDAFTSTSNYIGRTLTVQANFSPLVLLPFGPPIPRFCSIIPQWFDLSKSSLHHLVLGIHPFSTNPPFQTGLSFPFQTAVALLKSRRHVLIQSALQTVCIACTYSVLFLILHPTLRCCS